MTEENPIGEAAPAGRTSPGPGTPEDRSLGSVDFYDDDADWTRRAWHQFAKYSQRGAMNVDQFITWAGELNVECDRGIVRQVVPKEQWDHITFETALKAVETIPTLEIQEGEGGYVDLEEAKDENTVQLGFFKYMWTMWLCGKKDPTKNYVMSIECNISPRFWLVFNASLVFLLVGGAILGLMSFLWLQNAETREAAVLKQLETTLLLAVRSISDNTFEISSRDIMDQAVTAARFLEQLKEQERADILHNVHTEHRVDKYFVESSLLFQEDSLLQKMMERLNALGKYSDVNPLGVNALLNLASVWIAADEGLWTAVAYNFRTNAIHWTNKKLPTAADRGAFATMVEQSVCIQEMRQRRNGEAKHVLGLTNIANSTLLYRFFPVEGLGMCFSIEPSALAALARHIVVKTIDDANDKTFKEIGTNGLGAPLVELTLAAWNNHTAAREEGNGEAAFVMETKSFFDQMICGLPSKKAQCDAFLKALKRCYDTHCEEHTETLSYYNGVPAYSAISYVPVGDFVVAHTTDLEGVEEKFTRHVLRTVNSINKRLTESTLELAVAARDPVTGRIKAQVTDYKFEDTCYGVCGRIPESVSAILNTFETLGDGAAFYPDYRPAPIVGGFSHMLYGINETFIVERDVTELRTADLDNVVSAVNAINAAMEDSTEILIFRQKGLPVAKTFDPYAPCTGNVICDSVPGMGVVARSDCPDCLRREIAAGDPVTTLYLTDLRFQGRCEHCDFSDEELPGGNHRMTVDAINHRSSATEHNGPDYTGEQTKYFYGFVEGMSTFFALKRDTADIQKQVVDNVLIGIIIAVVVIAMGVVILLISSRRVLNRIERDWQKYNRAIAREKERFNGMIEEVIPPVVLSRYRRGQRSVVESLASVCYACIDMVAFTERTRDTNARVPVRTIAYQVILYQVVAKKYNMFRLKCYADVAVFACGVNSRSKSYSSTAASQDAYQAAGFACTVLQLLSDVFAHYPQELAVFAGSFGGEDTSGPMKMCPVRIGLHCGPVSTGLIDVGTTPLYEHYGSTLGLTHRLQATCQPGRAHASSHFKDLVESVDATNSFEFDTLRKTMIKGKGTITSYPIRSAQVIIDEGILKRLRISYATTMYNFHHKRGARGAGDGTSQSQEKRSSSHLSSERSGGASSGGGSSATSSTGHGSDKDSTPR